MDLETENRLAALLMEEARRLRREADKEGVHVYLQKPNIRGRPNSRFLTATVLGVEQANRAAEISEMWRAREKERELDAKQRCEAKDKNTGMHARNGYLKGDYGSRHEENSAVSIFRLNKRGKVNSPCRGTHSSDDNEPLDSPLHCSSSKLYHEDSHSSGNTGLQDDEIEEFLHSRMKRGRGSVGCRMDDPGPYLHPSSANLDEHVINPDERVEERKHRILCFPKKPYFVESEKNHSKNWKIFKGDKSESKRRNDKKAKHKKKLRSGRHSTKSKPKARHQ